MKYDFPGNVRELENIIERGVALENSNIILPESLSLSTVMNPSEKPPESSTETDVPSIFHAVKSEEELFDLGLEKVVNDLEKRLIKFGLEKTNNSKMKAADLLQISFRSLRYKTKKYGID